MCVTTPRKTRLMSTVPHGQVGVWVGIVLVLQVSFKRHTNVGADSNDDEREGCVCASAYVTSTK